MINPYSLDMYSTYDEYDEIDDEIINKDYELNLREQTLFWQHFGYLKVLLIK